MYRGVYKNGCLTSFFKPVCKFKFWSYEHVLNIFLVAFDLNMNQRTFSKSFEARRTAFLLLQVAISDGSLLRGIDNSTDFIKYGYLKL